MQFLFERRPFCCVMAFSSPLSFDRSGIFGGNFQSKGNSLPENFPKGKYCVHADGRPAAEYYSKSHFDERWKLKAFVLNINWSAHRKKTFSSVTSRENKFP